MLYTSYSLDPSIVLKTLLMRSSLPN
jgi:hypothetical protein